MTTGYYDLDKLTFLQRQKYDHLFQCLYDTTNDKTVSRQDFLELLKKVQKLRNWPTGCPGYAQAERIIAKVWTAFQKGNKRYRHKQSQTHIRDHEWRQYWGDFVEAARAARGWPEESVDGDVNYGWQKDYMNFMFQLMDTNGDGSLDRSEYLKCFSSFGLSPAECNEAFDKFAIDSYGRPLVDVDINRFEELWFQYLTSDDLHGHPGNYLMGKLDLQQHAPSHYPMDQVYIGPSNDVPKKTGQQSKVIGVKPSSVTMVYGQITGGAPRIGNLDDDQVYDPSRRKYQNDPGVDVTGGRAGSGPNYSQRQNAPTARPANQYSGAPTGQMGVQYGQSTPPARQDSTGRSGLQIKVNSVANPSMASPTQNTSIQNTPVNYSSAGQVNLRSQQQQQPQRQISATSNSSATAPSIASFNCTVEDPPANSAYTRSRPGQQQPAPFRPANTTAPKGYNQPSYNQPQSTFNQPQSTFNQPKSTFNQPQSNYNQPKSTFNQPQSTFNQPQSTFNQPQSTFSQPQSNYNQPQSNYNQPQFNQPQSTFNQPKSTFNQPQSNYGSSPGGSYGQTTQPTSFSGSYGPEKTAPAGPRGHGQVRMPARQHPARRTAPFVSEPVKATPAPPAPPGGPRGGRPVYSDF